MVMKKKVLQNEVLITWQISTTHIYKKIETNLTFKWWWSHRRKQLRIYTNRSERANLPKLTVIWHLWYKSLVVAVILTIMKILSKKRTSWSLWLRLMFLQVSLTQNTSMSCAKTMLRSLRLAITRGHLNDGSYRTHQLSDLITQIQNFYLIKLKTYG